MRNEADRDLPPRMQYYNKLKGKPKLLPWETDDPESLNVRMVGKWGRGPAASVTGRDTLIYLGLGSEVAIFNAANGSNPRIINEIQCRYVVDRVILKDNLLYAVLQGGIEVFDITDPARAFRIKYLPISVVDMCIRDTLAYTIDADSFKVYRIVSPESLARVGACADSGYYITADQGFAYLCDRWGLYVVDATNPASPHRASTVTGQQPWAVWTEGGYCYYTEMGSDPALSVADVSDPYHPAPVGRRAEISGYDIYKIDFYVYLSEFSIADVSDPSNIGLIGSVGNGGIGVWTRTPFSSSFLAAGSDGLRAVDITDPVHPVIDTAVAGADYSYDAAVIDDWCHVANYYAGMKVISTANPESPVQVGSYDSLGSAPKAYCISAVDSFVCLGIQSWGPTGFRVVDVSQPDDPILAAALPARSLAKAISIRDTFAYFAMDGFFDIISIANPRAPRLVGSCGLPSGVSDLSLSGNIACIAGDGVFLVDISNPTVPVVVGTFDSDAMGVDVIDTILYVAAWHQGLRVASIAQPSTPREIGVCPIEGRAYDVVCSQGIAYVGGTWLRTVDIRDPSHPVEIGYYRAPYHIRRVAMRGSLVFAACFGAGVCIFDTASTSGVGETPEFTPTRNEFTVTPNPASDFINVKGGTEATKGSRVRIYSITGRTVVDLPFTRGSSQRHVSQQIDISGLPDGCYLVRLEPSARPMTRKIIKTIRR